MAGRFAYTTFVLTGAAGCCGGHTTGEPSETGLLAPCARSRSVGIVAEKSPPVRTGGLNFGP
jgi:hypothetical protein